MLTSVVWTRNREGERDPCIGENFGSCYSSKVNAFSFLQAYLCQGDALMAMKQFDEAEKFYSTSLQIDPSIRRSRSFKVFFTEFD